MKLDTLLKNVKVINKEKIDNPTVNNVVIDSRKVKNNDLYVALEGENFDGHDFVLEAKERGASAIITSKEVGIDTIVVEDTREALAVISGNYYNNPGEKLIIIGIVGTNGKTTTCHLIEQLLTENNIKTAIIGTLGYKIDNCRCDVSLTTPDPMLLNKCLADAVISNAKAVVMEVSAHSIYYKKVNNLKFNLGVFTNVSQDHLDFFKTMENYIEVKKSFFNRNRVDFSIVNADDKVGQDILKDDNILKVSYGIENPSDIFAIDIKQDIKGSSFIVNAFDIITEINIPLPGRYNIYNILSAVAVALSLKVPIEDITNTLRNIKPVDGRFNVINAGKMVIIDYAHSPDSLDNLLRAVKPLAKKKLITVFGCGGNRDSSKRSIMGSIAEKYSDLVIVTSDNPRFEKPIEIIKDIIQGFNYDKYLCMPDRALAINTALKIADSDDIVVIAGKGSEDYLDINGKKIFYSDKEEVLKYAGESK